MRVEIMSMQRVVNYGSFLQALALRTMIESLGHSVQMVDFHPGRVATARSRLLAELRYQGSRAQRAIESTRMARALRDAWLAGREDAGKAFRACYPMLDMTQTPAYQQGADALVIGSDEVFNCVQPFDFVGFAPELLGGQCKARRLISYAASFGYTTVETLRACGKDGEAARLLRRFDALSVRDAHSRDVVRALCGVRPQMHVDPVLAGDLEARAWTPIDETRFLLVYGYGGRFTRGEGEAIRAMARRRGLRTIAAAGRQPFCDAFTQCGPDQILSYVRGADCIVTETFHGVIFAAICRRPFVALCRWPGEVKAGHVPNAQKMMDLLSKLNLTDRVARTPQEIDALMDRPIDFDAIDALRARERARTMRYLMENLAG